MAGIFLNSTLHAAIAYEKQLNEKCPFSLLRIATRKVCQHQVNMAICSEKNHILENK